MKRLNCVSGKTLAHHSLALPITLLMVLIGTRFGGLFSLPPSNISAFWPVNALLFSAVFLMPERQRTIALLLALPTYAGAELWIGYPLPNAVIYGFANVAEVTALLWLLKLSATTTLAFDKLKSLFTLIALALLVSPLGGAIGAMGAALAGASFSEVFLRWSFADFFGYCLCVPLALTWSQYRQLYAPQPSARTLEFVALLAILLCISVFSSGDEVLGFSAPLGAQFLPMPILLWAALRFGPPGGALATIIVACTAFFSATHGVGLFAIGSPEENVVSLQLFFASLVVSVMTIASLNAERNESFIALRQEIAERKRAEEELRRHKDQLEETVQQRTAELLLARDAAEAANKAKSIFLANMSHELRTPLNAILGFSSMMRRDPNLIDNHKTNLDIINRSGEHLLSLINDVLEVAKIEAGRLQLEITAFDLGRLVRDVTEMMQIRAQEKGLRLLFDQSSAFPRYIKGDEARIRQILINLISNAVKFTKQGGVTVRLGVKDNTRHHLLIEVEDTGPGIAPEDQNRLFEPFVQLTESAAQRGTGLGLTICHQFIRMMGGRIAVESTLGKGALFRVELPVEPADPADILEPEARNPGEVIGLAPGQPRYRILIAEDQRENQLLLSRLMSDIGLEVKVAENGEQCLKMFQDWRPNLIWMDRQMPVMDGIEASKRLRLLPYGRNVKIVAVTASAFKEQQQEMLDAGMDDFVRKPYRFDEIYACLARQLGLEYLYQNGEAAGKSASVTPNLTMLSALSPTLRQQLRKSLENLDSDKIAKTIRQIGKTDSTLGFALFRLADNFDYPAILNALDATE